METLAPWVVAGVALCGFILNTIIQIRGGVWSAATDRAKLKDELSEKIDKLRVETSQSLVAIELKVDDGIEKARTEARASHDNNMKAFGETILALKEKLHTDALATEKAFQQYLRREDFFEISRAKDSQVSAMDKRIDDRLGRLETKLDQALAKL